MDRRISPPRDYEELLDRLTESPTPSQLALFQSKQKALMFAAALGYALRERTPLERKGTSIRMDVFEKALDDGFINALAAAEAKTLGVLRADREDERATIFEEYAHRGLAEIQRRCFELPGDPLQLLVAMTEEATHPAGVEVSGIDPSLLKNLVG